MRRCSCTQGLSYAPLVAFWFPCLQGIANVFALCVSFAGSSIKKSCGRHAVQLGCPTESVQNNLLRGRQQLALLLLQCMSNHARYFYSNIIIESHWMHCVCKRCYKRIRTYVFKLIICLDCCTSTSAQFVRRERTSYYSATHTHTRARVFCYYKSKAMPSPPSPYCACLFLMLLRHAGACTHPWCLPAKPTATNTSKRTMTSAATPPPDIDRPFDTGVGAMVDAATVVVVLIKGSRELGGHSPSLGWQSVAPVHAMPSFPGCTRTV